MTASTDNDAGHSSPWGRIAYALLGTMMFFGATVAVADERKDSSTIDHTERFAFTGVYRFTIPPAMAPKQSARLMGHPLTSVSSPVSSKPAPTTAIAAGAEQSLQAAADNGRPIPETTPTTTAPAHVAVINATVKSENAAGPHAETAAVVGQSRPSDSLPVHNALSKPADRASTDEATPEFAVTRSLEGRIIDVPPLPELYQRPAGQSRIRPTQSTYRARRAGGRKSYSKSAKTTKTKSLPTGTSRTNWMNKALYGIN